MDDDATSLEGKPATRKGWWAVVLPAVAGSLAAITAAVLYGLFRIAYVEFYLQFGLTPSDVGIGPTGVLVDHAFYLLLLVLVYSTVTIAALVVAGWVLACISIVDTNLELRIAMRDKYVRWTRKSVKAAAIVVPAFYLVFVSIDMGQSAERRGECVRAGYGEIGQSAFIPSLRDVTSADDWALPASVRWIAAKVPEPPALTHELLFLGQLNDFIVLWSVWAQAALRVPREDVVVSVRRSYPKGWKVRPVAVRCP